MSAARKAAAAVGAVVALYLAFILLGGFFFSGCFAASVEEQLSEALAADVEVEDASMFIASGNASLEGVTIKRDGVDIVIGDVKVSMAAGGLMVISRQLERVVASKIRASFSARGAIDMARRDRSPVHIDEMLIRDAQVTISPTLIIPGLGKVEATIESATSRDVNLASAVSWVSKLDEMVAKVELPGGAGAGASYRDGKLDLTGSWFGADALSFPFEIPELGTELLEVEQMTIIGKELAKAVAKHVATDKLWDAAKNLFD